MVSLTPQREERLGAENEEGVHVSRRAESSSTSSKPASPAPSTSSTATDGHQRLLNTRNATLKAATHSSHLVSQAKKVTRKATKKQRQRRVEVQERGWAGRMDQIMNDVRDLIDTGQRIWIGEYTGVNLVKVLLEGEEGEMVAAAGA